MKQKNFVFISWARPISYIYRESIFVIHWLLARSLNDVLFFRYNWSRTLSHMVIYWFRNYLGLHKTRQDTLFQSIRMLSQLWYPIHEYKITTIVGHFLKNWWSLVSYPGKPLKRTGRRGTTKKCSPSYDKKNNRDVIGVKTNKQTNKQYISWSNQLHAKKQSQFNLNVNELFIS